MRVDLLLNDVNYDALSEKPIEGFHISLAPPKSYRHFDICTVPAHHFAISAKVRENSDYILIRI